MGIGLKARRANAAGQAQPVAKEPAAKRALDVSRIRTPAVAVVLGLVLGGVGGAGSSAVLERELSGMDFSAVARLLPTPISTQHRSPDRHAAPSDGRLAVLMQERDALKAEVAWVRARLAELAPETAGDGALAEVADRVSTLEHTAGAQQQRADRLAATLAARDTEIARLKSELAKRTHGQVVGGVAVPQIHEEFTIKRGQTWVLDEPRLEIRLRKFGAGPCASISIEARRYRRNDCLKQDESTRIFFEDRNFEIEVRRVDRQSLVAELLFREL